MMWGIKVIWRNGEEEFVKEGRGNWFTTKRRANEMADFMKQGMDPLDYQSINVVPRPAKRGHLLAEGAK